MKEEENTTQKEQKNEGVMKVYGYTPLIRTLLHGTVITESVYLIGDYWSSYLNAAGNFATNNMNMFNTTILPQLNSGYQNMINNPITSALITTGVVVAYKLTDLARTVNYGGVEKTGYFFGESNIQKVFDYSKYLTLPTTIVAGLYSTISGTVQSWPMFNADFLKNTSNVLGNYSALFTTVAIGTVLYSSEPLVKYLTNLSRGIYEKTVMVKELFKDIFKSTKEQLKEEKVEPEQVDSSTTTTTTPIPTAKSKSKQVEFFERLTKVKGKFSIDLSQKNKN